MYSSYLSTSGSTGGAGGSTPPNYSWVGRAVHGAKNLYCYILSTAHIVHSRELPYSSKFSWHNIFVNFVIDPSFINFLLTKI